MTRSPYLIAAYVAAWVIHGAYIWSMISRYLQLKREAHELETEKKRKTN